MNQGTLVAKTYKSILVVMCAMVLMTMAGSCRDYASRKAIAEVLEQDHLIEENAKLQFSGDSIQESMQGLRYVENCMSAIDLSGCPGDFVAAYDRHRQAWRSLYNVLLEAQAVKEDAPGFWECFIDGFLWGLTGIPIGDFGQESEYKLKQLEQEYEKIAQEFSDSFSLCLAIAEKYGVDIKPYSR